MTLICDGDLIFIVHDHRRQWIREIQKDQTFHCDRGFLKYNDIIGLEYGCVIQLSPTKNKVSLLKPLPGDIINHMKRESQIIYPEDIGLILVYSNLTKSSTVLEAGTGSGTVSSILAKYCTESGKIHTFDIREVAIKQAKKNIEELGSSEIVEVKLGDILEDDFKLRDISFVMLDLATTWLAVPKMKQILAQDGRICLFSPTIEQVKKNCRVLRDNGFYHVETMELLKRTFQVKPNATRPHGRMVGHTGYLTFGSLGALPLLNTNYTSYYTPENIGNLFIYGNIKSNSDILVISYENSLIHKHLHYYLQTDYKKIVLKLPSVNQDEDEDEFSKNINENISENKKRIFNFSNQLRPEQRNFETILIDNVYYDNFLKDIYDLIKRGGNICILSQYIENMKYIFESLKELNCIEIRSSELIRRTVISEIHSSYSKPAEVPSQGYLTIARKIIDDIEDEQPGILGVEYVETFLDVGVDFKESLPPEDEKIDFSALKDDF